jgi:small multidrug resistance pump
VVASSFQIRRSGVTLNHYPAAVTPAGSVTLAWAILGLGILLEVAGTTCMKMSDGLVRFWPSVFMFGFYAVSLGTLARAFQGLDLSTGYAIWSAVGTALVVTIGIVWFGEQATPWRLLWLLVTLAGIVGLRSA